MNGPQPESGQRPESMTQRGILPGFTDEEDRSALGLVQDFGHGQVKGRCSASFTGIRNDRPGMIPGPAWEFAP